MAQSVRELPLFPLGAVVLFPGMPLPLRIFEERYKLMLSDIRQTDSSFGVVLIREGVEVGEPAVPHQVGTVARIRELGPEEAGQIQLVAVGEQRFRVQETLRERPYIIARVEIYENETADVRPDLVDRAGAAFREYVQTAMGLHGGWSEKVELPSDPMQLSYFIGGALNAEPHLRQRLLEAADCAERLEGELELLQEGTKRLKEQIDQEWRRTRFSNN
jgi:Lon protease-like protein